MLAATNQFTLEAGDALDMEIILPEELKSFFYESGYLPTTAEESRGNARLRVRSVGEMLHRRTPPALLLGLAERGRRTGKVLIKDLSRSGIGLLFHTQIYPQERLQIRFQGRLIDTVFVRCRRLGECCYDIGGRIMALESAGDTCQSV